MPEFFRVWLISLSDVQKDEMWVYFDGYVGDAVIEIVGREDGLPNDMEARKAEIEGRLRGDYGVQH